MFPPKLFCTYFIHVIPGASIPPETMMHFPLCFRFSPYFPKIFRLCGKFSKCYLFPKFFSIFICQNFWWPCLVIDPLFSLFQHISPLFCENYYFPPTLKNSPMFSKYSPAFYILYVYFVYPLLWPWCIYASPNARTDAPVSFQILMSWGKMLQKYFFMRTQILTLSLRSKDYWCLRTIYNYKQDYCS